MCPSPTAYSPPPLRLQAAWVEGEGAVGAARGAGEKRKRELDEIEERLLEAERRAAQGGGRDGGEVIIIIIYYHFWFGIKTSGLS